MFVMLRCVMNRNAEMARHLWSRSHLSPTRLKEFQADPDVPRAQKNANVAEQEALRIMLRDLEVGVDRAERGLEERAAATQHAAAGAAAAAPSEALVPHLPLSNRKTKPLLLSL